MDLLAYLGTNDAVTVEKRIAKGDEKAKLIYDAMAYQVAKEIGAASAVLKGRSMQSFDWWTCYGKEFVNRYYRRVDWISDVFVYPGENELQALSRRCNSCLIW